MMLQLKKIQPGELQVNDDGTTEVQRIQPTCIDCGQPARLQGRCGEYRCGSCITKFLEIESNGA